MVPGTGVEPGTVWKNLSAIVYELGPNNRALLGKRDRLQSQIDAWHRERQGQPIDADEYQQFIRDIGYLLPEGEDFEITTTEVDPEIATIAGPQLVVPVGNPRFAVNAVNARWGSLYDALYATDVISTEDGAEPGGEYNPVRGERVVQYAAEFLDAAAPLSQGSHADVTQYRLEAQNRTKQLRASLSDGTETSLSRGEQFVGYQERGGVLGSVLLRHHGLHIEIQIDSKPGAGARHPAGVNDVMLEAAVSTIQDFEDAAAAVDAEDKAHLYRCWLEIMKGTLETTIESGREQRIRRMNSDRSYLSPEGESFTLPGRSLLLVRIVGLHMYTDSVTTSDGAAIPEGFLDAMLVSLAAMHDLCNTGRLTNSRAGNIYIVRPKLHSREEVAATVELFDRIEDALGLERNTIKLGVMDEERRMTVNLKEAIRAASARIIFIKHRLSGPHR